VLPSPPQTVAEEIGSCVGGGAGRTKQIAAATKNNRPMLDIQIDVS
jgi:hypothetical protein